MQDSLMCHHSDCSGQHKSGPCCRDCTGDRDPGKSLGCMLLEGGNLGRFYTLAPLPRQLLSQTKGYVSEKQAYWQLSKLLSSTHVLHKQNNHRPSKVDCIHKSPGVCWQSNVLPKCMDLAGKDQCNPSLCSPLGGSHIFGLVDSHHGWCTLS